MFIYHDTLYLHLPYYPLRDLEFWLEENKQNRMINAMALQRFARQLTDALAYLADVGIVHCDIKPTNILIEQDKDDHSLLNAVLTDFDISKTAAERVVARREETTTALVNRFTLGYAPPEVLYPSPGTFHEAHPRVDIFGLGAVIYHMHFYPRKLPQPRKKGDDITADDAIFARGNDTRPDWCMINHLKFVVQRACALKASSRPSATLLLRHEYMLQGTDLVRAAINECPSYWQYSQSNVCNLVEDSTLCQTMQDIMNNSAKPLEHGIGRDSHNERFQTFKVHKIYRVENPTTWAEYVTERRELRKKGYQRPNIELKTKDIISRLPFISTGTEDVVSECFLFHATQRPDSVIFNGFDVKYAFAGAANGAMFGRGIYFADSASKADQYNRATGQGVMHKMLLVRVLLGRSIVINAPRQGAPFLPVVEQESTATTKVRYDSVVTDPENMIIGGVPTPMRFKEIVVGENKQTYPEFIIEYTREQ